METLGLLALLFAVYVATSEGGRDAIREIWHERHPSMDWPHPDTRPALARARAIILAVTGVGEHHHPDVHPVAALAHREHFPQLDWWQTWLWKRRCRREIGHCWHSADAMIGWACCECPAETDGMPKDRCTACQIRREQIP